MTDCAIKENSVKTLGCVVECSIGNWATAELFVKCMHECDEKNSLNITAAKQSCIFILILKYSNFKTKCLEGEWIE